MGGKGSNRFAIKNLGTCTNRDTGRALPDMVCLPLRRALTRRWLHAHGERRANDGSIKLWPDQLNRPDLTHTLQKLDAASYTWFRP